VPDVNIKGIWTWEPTTRNPWGKKVPLKGSDAGQFHPFLEDKSEKLYAFVSDLEYNVEFDFIETQKYEGLTVNKYMTDPSLLANYSTIPEKIIYNAKYSGIGNLTSVYKAPIFAS